MYHKNLSHCSTDVFALFVWLLEQILKSFCLIWNGSSQWRKFSFSHRKQFPIELKQKDCRSFGSVARCCWSSIAMRIVSNATAILESLRQLFLIIWSATIDRDSETIFKEKMKNKIKADLVDEEKQEMEIKKQIERAEQLMYIFSSATFIAELMDIIFCSIGQKYCLIF